MIEFFTSEDGADIMVSENGLVRIFSDQEKELIDQIYIKLQNDYPEALTALISIYGKAWNFKFLSIRRFLKCNFSRHDSIQDISSDFEFKFEIVKCPLRGECTFEKTICTPKFNTTLSKREISILQLIAENLSEQQIAERLFISINTMKTHRQHIYKKIGLINKADAVKYISNMKNI